MPPGHLLIFSQDIVHEIVSKAIATESLRLFVGFRLTKASEPLLDKVDVIADQVCLPLPPRLLTCVPVKVKVSNTVVQDISARIYIEYQRVSVP